MEIIPIPADPSREDLRGARELLKGLAAVNVAGAAEQLKAVEMLMRQKYPRIVDPNAPKRTRRKKKRRRTLIQGIDARSKCDRCRGCGVLNPRLPKCWIPSPITCPKCEGSGIMDGIAEHNPADTHAQGILARGERPVRGEFARQIGVSDYVPMPPAPHRRGFFNGTVVHRNCPEAVELLSMHAGRFSQIDLSAALEGIAMDAVSAGENEIVRPRGRRLMGSRRIKQNLTPNQQRLSKMADRVRQEQTAHNRTVRRNEIVERGPSDEALDDALRLCGIDPKAWRKALKAVPPTFDGTDSAVIREARRRGDLPPDDLIEWADENAVTLRDGRRVVIEGRVDYAAHVFRRSLNKVVRMTGGIRVREKDGTVDVMHPDDIAVA